VTKLRQLATQRPAAEQGTEVGQARATLRLGYLWPLCRLPSTPTNALTLPLAPLLLNTLPCSAFAPQETPEASLAPGCAARPLMLKYCWPVAVFTTPRAREQGASMVAHQATSTIIPLQTQQLPTHPVAAGQDKVSAVVMI